VQDNVAALIKMGLDNWIATSDSSLDGLSTKGAGIEFITRPDSYENHVKHFTQVFDKHGDVLANTEGCGLHVHVSREAFVDDGHIDRLAALVESFTDAQLLRLTGRTPSSYCARQGYKTTGGKYTDIQGDRYRLINTLKGYTVEFRLCRTTKTIEKLKSRLQLILSLVNFSSIYSGHSLNIQQFFCYCENRSNEYPELWETVKPLVEHDFVDYWDTYFACLRDYAQLELPLTYA